MQKATAWKSGSPKLPIVCILQVLYSASVATIMHYLLMLAWECMAIFKHTSLLVISFVGAEDMEPGVTVDVTLLIIIHVQVIEAFI